MSDSKAFSPSANKMDGMCECGCGEPAPIARRTDSRCGVVKGQPQRFILGHGNRGRTKVREFAEQLCQCGCGAPAPIAKSTDSSRGIVKGQPQLFILGHANRGRTKVKKQAEREKRGAELRGRGRQRIESVLNALPNTCLTIEGRSLDVFFKPLVYVFCKKKKCLYVGSGSSADRPFDAAHHRRSDLAQADRVLLYSCESRDDAFVLERSLIAKLKPVLNQRPGVGPAITTEILLQRAREYPVSIAKAS